MKELALLFGFSKALLFRGRFYFKFEKKSNYFIPSELGTDYYIGTVVKLGFTSLVMRCLFTEYDMAILENIVSDMCGTVVAGPGHAGMVYNRKGTFCGYIVSMFWLWDKYSAELDPWQPGIAWSPPAKGWIAYHNKGSQIFKIGDMLFDSDWFPTGDWWSNKEWLRLRKAEKISNAPYRKWLLDQTPFVKRGFEKIKTPEQARQAAINYYNYISK